MSKAAILVLGHSPLMGSLISAKKKNNNNNNREGVKVFWAHKSSKWQINRKEIKNFSTICFPVACLCVLMNCHPFLQQNNSFHSKLIFSNHEFLSIP